MGSRRWHNICTHPKDSTAAAGLHAGFFLSVCGMWVNRELSTIPIDFALGSLSEFLIESKRQPWRERIAVRLAWEISKRFEKFVRAAAFLRRRGSHISHSSFEKSRHCSLSIECKVWPVAKHNFLEVVGRHGFHGNTDYSQKFIETSIDFPLVARFQRRIFGFPSGLLCSVRVSTEEHSMTKNAKRKKRASKFVS